MSGIWRWEEFTSPKIWSSQWLLQVFSFRLHIFQLPQERRAFWDGIMSADFTTICSLHELQFLCRVNPSTSLQDYQKGFCAAITRIRASGTWTQRRPNSISTLWPRAIHSIKINPIPLMPVAKGITQSKSRQFYPHDTWQVPWENNNTGNFGKWNDHRCRRFVFWNTHSFLRFVSIPPNALEIWPEVFRYALALFNSCGLVSMAMNADHG